MGSNVYFCDGSFAGGGSVGRKMCEIHPNDICTIEPDNPRNKARGNRGRICKVTGKYRTTQYTLLAHVEFLDEKGGYGYIDPSYFKKHEGIELKDIFNKLGKPQE